MSDIEKYIAARKARNPKAWENFDENYRQFAIGMLLAELREGAGLSVTEFARRTKMKKAAISRLENHGEDVRLSTITRYVEATGKPLALKISPSTSGKRPRGRKKVPLNIELVQA